MFDTLKRKEVGDGKVRFNPRGKRYYYVIEKIKIKLALKLI